MLTMIPFIIWDVWFTESGFWGFNPVYLQGVYLFSLPIEEWMFFIAIPYACVFTHVALIELFPIRKLSDRLVQYISFSLMILFVIGVIFAYDRWYTFIDMIMAIGVLGIVYAYSPRLLNRFFLTFLVMLIPFFIVNGILTGTGIENEVVWYNNNENLGVRMGTIPVEDSVYAFSMILLNLFLLDKFTKGNLALK